MYNEVVQRKLGTERGVTMNKDEVLEKSRQENKGKHDECEIAAYGTASRVGMLVGALACIVLILASEFIFHIPEIGLVGWLVYFSMQGSSNIVLFKKLGGRKELIWGIVELVFAVVFAATIVIKNVV